MLTLQKVNPTISSWNCCHATAKLRRGLSKRCHTRLSVALLTSQAPHLAFVGAPQALLIVAVLQDHHGG